VQTNILEQYPSADLHVYAIWLPMLSTDARSEWHEDLLPDPRVRHFWDEERIAGLWFAKANTGGLGYAGIVWDAYLLFGPGAVWKAEPLPLAGAGATVIGKSGELEDQARPLLAAE
jgi:hypothetical protein